MTKAWDQSLTVGLPLIDEQHQQLFASLDSLLAALRESRGKEEVGKILAFLGDYTVKHFGAEEQLMRRYRYPDIAAHLAEHQQFLRSFQALVAEFEARGASASLALRVMTQVGDWLRGHIKKPDAALVAFLRANSEARSSCWAA